MSARKSNSNKRHLMAFANAGSNALKVPSEAPDAESFSIYAPIAEGYEFERLSDSIKELLQSEKYQDRTSELQHKILEAYRLGVIEARRTLSKDEVRAILKETSKSHFLYQPLLTGLVDEAKYILIRDCLGKPLYVRDTYVNGCNLFYNSTYGSNDLSALTPRCENAEDFNDDTPVPAKTIRGRPVVRPVLIADEEASNRLAMYALDQVIERHSEELEELAYR